MGKLVDETGAWIEPPEANSTPDPTPYLEGAQEMREAAERLVEQSAAEPNEYGVEPVTVDLPALVERIASYVASIVEPLKARIAELEQQNSALFDDNFDADTAIFKHIDRANAAEAEVARLRKAVRQGAAWFREYEEIHMKKGDLGSDVKARRNAERAETLEAALSPKETEDESSTQGRS